MLNKTDFITLADALLKTKPPAGGTGQLQWEADVNALADVCANNNARFDRKRWLDYVFGVRTSGVKARKAAGGR